MPFFILIMAFVFSYFLVRTQLPMGLVAWITELQMVPWLVVLTLVVFYISLGCVLESIAMMLITVPVFLPPAGMNIFVIRSQVPDVPLSSICMGIVPFLGASFVLVGLLLTFPQMALWLPRVLY